MVITLAEQLKMETDIPFLSISYFHFLWKPNHHAFLNVNGYLNERISWKPEEMIQYQITIWREEEGKIQNFYRGYVSEIEVIIEGKINQIKLTAMSASYLLDREIRNASVQQISKTYGEVIRERVAQEGGRVICNRESDRKLLYPIIQWNETTWQFAKRMASRLGIYLVPDIETGNPNLWFGMRNGKKISEFAEIDCQIQITSIGKKNRVRIQVKNKKRYKIGDWTSFFGQKVTIVSVEGYYKNGELLFTYILDNRTVYPSEFKEEQHPAGEGCWGVIKEVKEESVKLALDLDNGKETGDYFYPYYPETGNSLYAMPETGARALLYFFQSGQREGAVIHCLNRENKDEIDFRDKVWKIENGNIVHLLRDNVSLSRGENQNLTLSDSMIFGNTLQDIQINAEGKIKLKARHILINASNEVNFYKG